MGLMGIWSDVGRERGGEPQSILVVSGRVGEWVDGPLGGHRVGKGGWMGDEIGEGRTGAEEHGLERVQRESGRGLRLVSRARRAHERSRHVRVYVVLIRVCF